MKRLRRCFRFALRGFLLFIALLVLATLWQVHTPQLSLRSSHADDMRFQVLDRNGKPLSSSYQNRFNTTDILPLYAVPEILQHAIITAEDRHFFRHHGVDWRARFSAVHQNILAGKKVRGASTITEQVVRILHPRKRTLWSRWIEGFEALLLERHNSKGDILAFYMNQVPYAANRNGVAQAARYYFDRDLDTLTHKEMLALAVLPRAPSALDLYHHPEAIEPGIGRLIDAMQQRGEIDTAEADTMRAQQLHPQLPPASPGTAHFISYIRETIPYRLSARGTLPTTLDAGLQQNVQMLLDQRIEALGKKRVHNGAALVVDHRTGEILAWAVGGNSSEARKQQTPGSAIDTVRTPRQPGSALKPFLYALALDSGWSPATILDDAPMSESIGTGLHDFHNYSRSFYGKITLREALGNSLNIPALETIGFVGPARYLDRLHTLGFESLTQSASFYSDGLALGNGEVSLFEMVQAYCALANRGVFRPLTPLPHTPFSRETTQVYSEEAASLIGHILSDPFARRREFGAGSVLNLPIQTAVKTGTSTDYRDAWVLGYNANYTVGVWVGNLDHTPMDNVTGSTGPALVLRSIFAELSSRSKTGRLYLSPKLERREICAEENTDGCYSRTEFFIAGTEPKNTPKPKLITKAHIVRPGEGLRIAYDPRIPAALQAFEFVIDTPPEGQHAQWYLNDQKLESVADETKLLWPVVRGQYVLKVELRDAADAVVSSDTTHFVVK